MTECKEAVRAWALVDEDGNILPAFVYEDKDWADFAVACSNVPTRVVPVEIRPLGDGE